MLKVKNRESGSFVRDAVIGRPTVKGSGFNEKARDLRMFVPS